MGRLRWLRHGRTCPWRLRAPVEEYLKGLGFFSLEMTTLYRTLRQLYTLMVAARHADPVRVTSGFRAACAWLSHLEKDGLLLLHLGGGPGRAGTPGSDAGRAWLDSGAVALEGYRAMIDRFFGL